jgi:hypothetical protein
LFVGNGNFCGVRQKGFKNEASSLKQFGEVGNFGFDCQNVMRNKVQFGNFVGVGNFWGKIEILYEKNEI